MRKRTSGKLIALGAACLLWAGAAAGAMENNTNLFGSDYRSFEATSAQQCEAACGAEAQCKAWTWVRPTSPATPAAGGGRLERHAIATKGVCWLKNAVPVKSANACCVSGIRATAPVRSQYGVLSEGGADALSRQGIVKPEILTINGQRPQGFVFGPGLQLEIHGRAMGSGGQLHLAGSFRSPPRITVNDWRPSVIYARIDDGISGQEDLNDVRFEIRPTGRNALVLSGARFQAARETTLLASIPRHMVTLPGQTAEYYTNGERPGVAPVWPLWEWVRNVRERSVLVIRNNKGSPSAPWFAPGVDVYVLPLKAGFVIKDSKLNPGPSETHPNECNALPGGQYFQGTYSATVEQPSTIRISWGVGRCHYSAVLTASSHDANYSGYGLDVFIEGPRGVSPWKQ